MSIYAYVGLPRSGKSYNAVANVILPALREGRRVVTNVPVYRDRVLGVEGVTGTLVDFPVLEVAQDPELIRKYVTPGSVFVLDEVWRLWPAGLKTVDIPECYKSLLAEHGHMVDAEGRACHIVLVGQDLGNISPFARKLIEQTFIHTKMGHLGMEGRFRVDIYHGAVTGVIGPQKQRLREIFGTYTEEIWSLYKSHTLSVAPKDGANERAVDRRGNVLRKPMFVVGFPLALSLVAGSAWYLVHQFHRTVAKPASRPAAPLPAHPGFVDGVVNRPQPLLPSVAAPPKFRVLGYIEVPGDMSRSRAIVVGEKGAPFFRSMSHCRWIDGDYFECQVDGNWYGMAGESLAAHETGAVPVSLPAGAHAQPALPPSPAAQASVASDAAVISPAVAPEHGLSVGRVAPLAVAPLSARQTGAGTALRAR